MTTIYNHGFWWQRPLGKFMFVVFCLGVRRDEQKETKNMNVVGKNKISRFPNLESLGRSWWACSSSRANLLIVRLEMEAQSARFQNGPYICFTPSQTAHQFGSWRTISGGSAHKMEIAVSQLVAGILLAGQADWPWTSERMEHCC